MLRRLAEWLTWQPNTFPISWLPVCCCIYWFDSDLTLIDLGRNPGGKRTPQVSVHPTPDWLRLMTIRNLVEKARTSREQGPLKATVSCFAFNTMRGFIIFPKLYIRDGYICPFSGYSFDPNAQVAVKSKTAHILPFALHTQVCSASTIIHWSDPSSYDLVLSLWPSRQLNGSLVAQFLRMRLYGISMIPAMRSMPSRIAMNITMISRGASRPRFKMMEL